jgi:hypothetical protein
MLLAWLLGVGFIGIAPAANAASAGKSSPRSAESARNYVLESKRQGRGPTRPLPIGPSYIYYDYPYYYSRGYYPTHILGYVYYHPNYAHHRSHRAPGSLRHQKARRN